MLSQAAPRCCLRSPGRPCPETHQCPLRGRPRHSYRPSPPIAPVTRGLWSMARSICAISSHIEGVWALIGRERRAGLVNGLEKGIGACLSVQVCRTTRQGMSRANRPLLRNVQATARDGGRFGWGRYDSDDGSDAAIASATSEAQATARGGGRFGWDLRSGGDTVASNRSW